MKACFLIVCLWACSGMAILLGQSNLAEHTDPSASKRNLPNRVAPISPIFKDGFESGGTFFWDQTFPEPLIPDCNCYFSGDCASGLFCWWGPAGPFTEDICNWRLPKPNGVPGAGCTKDADEAGPICDGFCTSSEAGSIFGLEDPRLVVTGIRLWSAAILEPALSGGGPVDPELAAEALALPFASPLGAEILGRHVADMLSFAVDFLFYNNFCHFENHPGEPGPVIDLSGDPCKLEVAALVMDALVFELEFAGSGEPFISQIPEYCWNWQEMFGTRCPPGANVLECVYTRIQGAAQLLSRPPQN